MSLVFDVEPTSAPKVHARHEDAFARHESEVRYYCRRLPRLLSSARGSVVIDSEGAQFVDFLSACGSLNYGYNHPALIRAAIDYLLKDGIAAGLDFRYGGQTRLHRSLREQNTFSARHAISNAIPRTDWRQLRRGRA